MGLFSRNKRSQTPAWRNADGKIQCDESRCPYQTCDKGCPIHLQTMGVMLCRDGRFKEGAELIKMAVTIAPDFAEAWNNLGAAYGAHNDFEKARNAYERAYSLDRRPKALYGLALANRDCGRTKEAIHCCEEYRSRFSDGMLDEVYAELKCESDDKADGDEPTSVGLAKILVSAARRGNILTSAQGTFPVIPEVAVMAKSTITPMIDPIVKESEHDPNLTLLVWAAYAGIGTVYLWNTDWPKLKREGAFKLLTQERGVANMDEYITDMIGLKWGSLPSNDLINLLVSFANACVGLIERFGETVDWKNETTQRGFEAMFLFGMVYEMEQLGMR